MCTCGLFACSEFHCVSFSCVQRFTLRHAIAQRLREVQEAVCCSGLADLLSSPLCCIRSLPNLRAPRTKTRRPHVNTRNQTSEPCSEGIRSMCLTQINCLPASLCLDTACSWVFCSPEGRRETCGPNKPPECCVMSVGMLAFVALA